MFSDFKKMFQHLVQMGFFYQNSSIYDGLSNAWDYGPLGASLKRHLKNKLYDFFIFKAHNVLEIDTNIILHPNVWTASGHVNKFFDVYATCQQCNANFKYEENQNAGICPKCKSQLTEQPRSFNLLFQTNYGLLTKSSHFLRPETSQGIFINFANIVRTTRMKLPFGIGQFGKSFRNEITPKHMLFRTREFEQFELVYFVQPASSQQEFTRILGSIKCFLEMIGITTANYQVHYHSPHELAHYAVNTCDINFRFPFGWCELWGLSNRGDYDLKQHQAHSGVILSYFDPVSKERFFPHAIEPSVGIDRLVLAILCQAFAVEILPNQTERIVLHLPPSITPFQIMITALVSKLNKIAYQKIFNLLKEKTKLRVYYDANSNIGKKYRRADAIGVFYCITYDYQTAQNQTVTIRERRNMQQSRIAISQLVSFLHQQLF